MKTTFKTFAIAFALITATFSAQAEDKDAKKTAGFGTGIYSTKSGKINVMVEKVSPDATTTLLLKNEAGNIIYQETVGKKNQKFGRTLNVDGLQPGTYEIEVTSQGEKQSKTFELSHLQSDRTLLIK